MNQPDEEEPVVTYLEDGTPVQVILICDEMTSLYEDADSGEVRNAYWTALAQEIT